MKTSQRIHRNGASKRTISQVKTPEPTRINSTLQFIPSDCQDGTVEITNGGYNIMLFGHDEDASLAGIFFERKEFKALKTAAQRSGQTISTWLGDAIRVKLESAMRAAKRQVTA